MLRSRPNSRSLRMAAIWTCESWIIQESTRHPKSHSRVRQRERLLSAYSFFTCVLLLSFFSILAFSQTHDWSSFFLVSLYSFIYVLSLSLFLISCIFRYPSFSLLLSTVYLLSYSTLFLGLFFQFQTNFFIPSLFSLMWAVSLLTVMEGTRHEPQHGAVRVNPSAEPTKKGCVQNINQDIRLEEEGLSFGKQTEEETLPKRRYRPSPKKELGVAKEPGEE